VGRKAGQIFKYLLLCDGLHVPTKSINQEPAEARADIANCCGSETLIGIRSAELFKSQRLIDDLSTRCFPLWNAGLCSRSTTAKANISDFLSWFRSLRAAHICAQRGDTPCSSILLRNSPSAQYCWRSLPQPLWHKPEESQSLEWSIPSSRSWAWRKIASRCSLPGPP